MRLETSRTELVATAPPEEVRIRPEADREAAVRGIMADMGIMAAAPG